MTARWWVTAACLGAAAVVLCWPRRSRQARLMSPPRPAGPSLRARLEVLSSRRAMLLAVAFAALAGVLLAGPVAGVAVGAYGAIAARAVLRRRASRAETAMRTRSLDALCGLAADLRAGLPPSGVSGAAVLAGASDGAVTGPVGIEDRRMAQLTDAAWRLSERTGAPIADLIERIEADTRAIDRAGAAAAAQAAGARATAWLLAGLPVGGIVLGYSIGVDPLGVLLHSPIGAACAVGAIVLQVGGLTWADRLAAAGTARPEPAPSSRAPGHPSDPGHSAGDGRQRARPAGGDEALQAAGPMQVTASAAERDAGRRRPRPRPRPASESGAGVVRVGVRSDR
ncbi:type II secretion system F family protein [Phytohabitans kaempferiae]|uniref:Type II secretion system F family protein n=1 Tax=Phytohabitans kaempferiae TaxID=1620943 RepID=A0ABV6LWE9_9ACTN